ncbi:MAG: hypothetical protein IH945_12415 [Armatimonadetes bacterium]|nr:hypothetical protein [Armatimonadota bacterium]
MRNFAVLVLVGALLALFAGCSTDISQEDAVEKQDEIETAAADSMGVDEIPAEEQRD